MDGAIGEIRLFAGNFAPRNWAICNGQLLSVAQNSALFSILGTLYGGDGRNTFGLPDLRGRVPAGTGAGPGLSQVHQGQMFGTERTQLTIANIPAHNHIGTVSGHLSLQTNSASPNDSDDPDGAYYQVTSEDTYAESASGHFGPLESSLTVSVQQTGSGIPMENRQPLLAVNFIICLSGTYPSRS